MAQTIFYQDIFHGGVTAGGFSTGQGAGSGTVNLYIEPGSSIRKAYLFSYTINYPPIASITVNGIPYTFDTIVNKIMDVPFNFTYATPTRLYAKDITSDLTFSPTSVFNITIPLQSGLSANTGWWTAFLYIEYENVTMPVTSSVILVNNQKLIGNELYSVSNLNPVNISYPVGFSIYTDRTGSYYIKNDSIIFNGVYIGTVGGSDNVNYTWNFAGVKGHFYYQNNTLFGLDDDTPDAVMDSTDGLADVSSYLINNAISCNFQLTHVSFPNQTGASNNENLAYFLTYTTPCDTFSVKLLTEDTTVCRGQTVQLGVSGGNTSLSKPAYEWLPQKDLSCYTCANPVFSGDSSQVYTVRIWNTDSCSKVLPVRVKVLPPPVFGKITTQNTTCGAQSGALTVGTSTGSVSTADSLFFNNSYAGLTPLTLSNLGAGTDTLYLKDTNGCVSQDTLVTINSSNNTEALFTVNPQTGAAPLHVTTDNQSTQATDYVWYFLNDSTTVFAPNITFDTSGTYTVTLLAYQNDISCADTFSLSVTVYDSLQIIVPNVITANGDGQNDVFSIQVNAPCKGTVNIVNRWGNEVFRKDFTAQGKEKVLLWDGTSQGQKVDDGVYFYLFKLQDQKGEMHKLEGFLSVVH